MNRDFQDKVALVTGGASGIGRMAARRLAAEGAALVVADLNSEGAARTVQMIEQAGGKAISVVVDVAKQADNEAMFDAAEVRYGGLDIAFLNAGLDIPYARFKDTNVDQLDLMYRVNLRGAYLGLQTALARLRPGGAALVTASMAGLLGISEVAPYSAAKHGVVGLVKSAARDFAERRLRVNALCPGLTYTAMTGYQQSDEVADVLAVPDYRGGMTAQHQAEVALFLLSHRANGINGHAQLVDAGVLAALPPLEALSLPGDRDVQRV